MRVAVEPGRWRGAGVGDEHRPPGLQAVEAGIGQRCGGPAAPRRLVENEVDQARHFVARAIEQGQVAVAVPQRAQAEGQALDGGAECGRQSDATGLQKGAYVHQFTQHLEVGAGAAFGVAAVGQNLPADFLREEAQRAGEVGGVVGKGDRDGDQATECGEGATVEFLWRECGREQARVGEQPAHQLVTEIVVG